MSEIQQAAQSAKGLAKQFRNVLVVVEALENIGSLETAFEEITERVRQINELRVKAVDQRLIAEGSLKETLRKLDNADVDLVAALSSAERVVAEAATAGETIVDEARTAANVIAEVSENRKRNAQRDYNASMKHFNVREQAAIGRLEIINKELAELRERIGSK